jgi:DNA ligase-1
MLAATVTDRTKLRFPYLASPKLDGIRCLVLNGQVLSRSFKPIRNKHIQAALCNLPNMDGELIVGDAFSGDVFNRTTRGVMSASGVPAFTYHVFDTLADLRVPFDKRLAAAHNTWHKDVQVVPHTLVWTLNDLSQYEADMLQQGYEGVMLRHPDAYYKCGRATATENSLWKLKQFTDGEILVTKVLEGVINTNPTYKDELGETTRSMRQDGMQPSGKVGTIVGVDTSSRQTLEVSPGKMTHDQRRYYWVAQDHIVGKLIKYKCFSYGSIDVPRFATFQGFRDAEDMS